MSISTFNAFRSRNYRLYFAGQSVSLIGTWMQKTTVSWVVYSLTHSKFMLGMTVFAGLFPSFLLSFLGGIAADRFNRYRLLLLTQVISMVQAVSVTLLVFFRHYNVWEIIALTALLGVINAFDVPARQSLVYEMVENKRDLPNALALNSSMVNLSRLIGPAIAGLVIEKFGEVACFGSNALSFLAVILSLLGMRLQPWTPAKTGKNVLGQIREGLTYVRQTPSIGILMLMLAFMSLLVLPYTTLIPVYARDIFHGTASTYGIIDSAIGLGAFAGAIFLASLNPGRDLRKILTVNCFVFGVGLILFSHSTIYPLALFFAALGAFGMMSQVTITNTLIQTTVAPEMRGRVISLYAMCFFGMQPLGGLLVGWVSQHAGVDNTVMGQGVIAILIGITHVILLKHRPVKRNPVPVLRKQPVEAAQAT